MKIGVKGLTVYSAGVQARGTEEVWGLGRGGRNPVQGPYSKGSADQVPSGQRVPSRVGWGVRGATEQLCGPSLILLGSQLQMDLEQLYLLDDFF